MGYIRKALDKGYLDMIFVCFGRCVCCLLLILSMGSYHVCLQIHTTCCCFPLCTTETFGVQMSTLWGCKLGAGYSADFSPRSKKAAYSQFAATCMHPRVGF